MGFLADGKQLVTASRDGHQLWDLTKGSVVRTFGKADKPKPAANALPGLGALSLDGRLFAVYEKGEPIRIWNPTSGMEIRTIAMQEPDRKTSVTAVSMTFSSDGKTLALRGLDQ